MISARRTACHSNPREPTEGKTEDREKKSEFKLSVGLALILVNASFDRFEHLLGGTKPDVGPGRFT